MKKLDYSDLRDQLMECPKTWIPALIKILIEESYIKNVFIPSGASEFVKNIEKHFHNGEYNEQSSKKEG